MSTLSPLFLFFVLSLSLSRFLTIFSFLPEFTKVGDMNEAMQLLDAVFKTITAAISQHTANRLFFEEQIGIDFILLLYLFIFCSHFCCIIFQL